MNSHVVISSTGHRRIGIARDWLENRAAAEEVLIIGATPDAANELARKVAKKKGAAFAWHRLTLPQLAFAVATPILAARGLTPLSRIGAGALVARLVHRMNAEGRLSHYRSVVTTPGFPRAVAGVITELRLARISLDVVGACAPGLEPLIGAFEFALKEAGVTDWPGVLSLASEAASAVGGNRPRLIGLPTLILDVPIGNEAEFVFVESLTAAATEVLATVPSADQATLRRLRDRLGAQIEDLDLRSVSDEIGASSTSVSALTNLQRRLFKEEERPLEAKPDDTVEVFSAPGEGRECVEIARRVLSIARRGVPFDRIAVLLRSPDGYRAYVEEAFNRAGIPAHFARGAIRPDPAGRAFCALLKCAANGLSARRFWEYLSLGQVPDATSDGAPPDAIPGSERWVTPDSEFAQFSTEEAAEELQSVQPAEDHADEAPAREGQLRAPRRWEHLLIESAVIGGRDRWRRRIDGLVNDLRLRLSELAEEDETRAAVLARTLEDLAAFAAYAIPLIDLLDNLPKSANWGEWLDQLSALATRALKFPERVLSVLAELAPLGPVGPVALNEVLLVLEPLLLQVAVPPASQRYGKVFVVPVDATRGMSFDAVFVPGLAEKMFPRKIVEEPILLDSVRERIGDLATNPTRLEEERLALALVAGAAEQRICFSYSRLDLDQARPRVPSFYGLEAFRAAEGLLPDFAELARRAETATNARLGWPAPTDPADAIDEAEYDLALLNRLEARGQESPGAARHLVTANPYLARALRTRYQRWGRTWTASDGVLSRSETVRAIMAKHTLASRSYSPTALQNYAKCPYRLFLQTIHGLAPRDIPEAIDQLDPLQRGSLIHEVQFNMFARLREDGFLPVRPSNLQQAQQRLDAVIAEVATRYKDDLAPAVDRVWEDGVAAIRADLREWLRRASEDESGYVPWRFELSFGLEHRPERRQADPRSIANAVSLDCGIQLRGSIDLVERHPSGLARVTDHKTGKADAKRSQLVDGGRSLQPLLYALAAEKLFAGEAKVTAGRLYFCTSVGGFAEHVVSLDESGRAAAVQIAETIGDAIAGPFLPATPDKGQCDLCDFRVVCGPYEERRAARKPQGNLEPLLALRALP
jgi:ATP-dependent helicase/nuclease subunit B